jgi:hypothetical protein
MQAKQCNASWQFRCIKRDPRSTGTRQAILFHLLSDSGSFSVVSVMHACSAREASEDKAVHTKLFVVYHSDAGEASSQAPAAAPHTGTSFSKPATSYLLLETPHNALSLKYFLSKLHYPSVTLPSLISSSNSTVSPAAAGSGCSGCSACRSRHVVNSHPKTPHQEQLQHQQKNSRGSHAEASKHPHHRHTWHG